VERDRLLRYLAPGPGFGHNKQLALLVWRHRVMRLGCALAVASARGRASEGVSRSRMKTHLLAKTLVRADRVRSYEVRPVSPVGWEASQSEDQRIVETKRYDDWHRVERMLSRFTREIAELRQQGWQDA